jgi:predicted nucleic acid-binding protein
MTRVLLDSSAYIAFKKRHQGIQAVLECADEIVLSPIVLGELRAGYLQGSKTARNNRELAEFLESPRASVVSVDEETADRYAIIRAGLRKAGTPLSTNDIWIAASAMQHGLPILTTDADFLKIPQVIARHFPPA